MTGTQMACFANTKVFLWEPRKLRRRLFEVAGKHPPPPNEPVSVLRSTGHAALIKGLQRISAPSPSLTTTTDRPPLIRSKTGPYCGRRGIRRRQRLQRPATRTSQPSPSGRKSGAIREILCTLNFHIRMILPPIIVKLHYPCFYGGATACVVTRYLGEF